MSTSTIILGKQFSHLKERLTSEQRAINLTLSKAMMKMEITINPDLNKTIYMAMRNDYSETGLSKMKFEKTEEEYSKLIVKHLLENHKGHHGPLEHGWFSVRYPNLCEHFNQDFPVGGFQKIDDNCYIINLRAYLRLIDYATGDNNVAFKQKLLEGLQKVSPSIYDWYIITNHNHPKANRY